MYMEELHGFSSSKPIESLIRSYTISSDGSLNAGDFCEFINGQVKKYKYEETIDTAIPNAKSITAISACKINANQILVAYSTSNSQTFALIINMNGIVMNYGSPVVIGTSTTTTNIQTYLLDSSHALVVYADGLDTIAIHLNISGNTVSLNIGARSIGNVYSSSDDRAICIINPTTFICLYRASDGSVHALLYTINSGFILGNNITVYSSMGGGYYNLCKIDSTKVLATFTNGSSQTLMAVLTVSGTTITNNGALVSIAAYNYGMHSILLDSTHVLFVWNYGSGIKATIIAVGTTSYSLGSIFQINNIPNLSFLQCNMIDNGNHILLNFYDGADRYLKSSILLVSCTNMSINIINACSKICQQDANRSYVIPLDFTHLFYIKMLNTNALTGVFFNINFNICLNKEINPRLMALSSGSAGQSINFLMSGVSNAFSGLIPGKTYYCDDNGNLSLDICHGVVGLALSPTELLLQLLYK